jgi:sulfite exporter TauE/SafE
MAVFGAGTLPIMLGMGSIVAAFVKRFHWNFASLTNYMMIVSGIILLGRAYLNLGIMPVDLYNDIIMCR